MGDAIYTPRIMMATFSCNLETLKKDYLSKCSDYDKFGVRLVLCQGDDFTSEVMKGLSETYPKIRFSNYTYKKGSVTISEMRWDLLEMSRRAGFDYLYMTDDDFVFTQEGLDKVYSDYQSIISRHKDIGLVVYKRSTDAVFGFEDYSNIVRVGMYSGMLINLASVFGPFYSTNSVMFMHSNFMTVKYHEEYTIANFIYLNGYRVVKARANITHKRYSTGIERTLRQENKLEQNNSKKLCEYYGMYKKKPDELYYPDNGRQTKEVDIIHKFNNQIIRRELECLAN